MSNLNRIKVVDYTLGRSDSEDVNTDVPFTENFEKTRTIQQANVVLGAYVNRNYKDMQNKADKDEIPTKLSELTNDVGYITDGDIPSKTSDLTNNGEDGINPFITNQVNNLANYTNNTDLSTLLSGKASTTDLNNVKSAIDYKSINYMGNVVVESVRSKNMCDIYTSQLEASISSTDGAIITDQNNACGTNYISVKPNTTYIISANTTLSALRLSEYTFQKTHIQRTAQNNVRSLTITTSANTYYLRWSININDATTTIAKIEAVNLQLEEGSTATNYMPYQNFDGMEAYSNGEIVIGTFSGKPLYRKVINTTTPNSTNPTILATITNLSQITDMRGFIVFGVQQILMNFVYNTEINSLYVEGSNIVFKTNVNGYLNKTCYIIVEYTKTTD